MRRAPRACLVVALMAALVPAAFAEELALGSTVDTLLDYSREHNPEYAGMLHEASAAGERVIPAGALPDPRFRVELRDITRVGEQGPTLWPGRVGSTRYLLTQDLPGFGKRGLRREIATLEADGARGRAAGTWAQLSGRIKSAYALLYYIHRNERLIQEILDLMVRLEEVAQVRYAGGLAAQQDVIRAQVEQTSLRTELVATENERRQTQAQLNALVARPADAPLAEPRRLRPLPTPVELDFMALAKRVRERNPQLFAAEARIKAAEKTRELTHKNRYPDFTVGASPVQNQGSIKEWELMFEVNIPLQQAARRGQERESEAMLWAARARKEATTNEALSELAENLSGIEAARRTESLATTSLLPQAELTFKAALAGYETGTVDFATLLDAQRQIREARQTQIKAQAEGRVLLAGIETLLGEDL